MFCKLWLNSHLLLVQHQDDAPTQHHLKMLSIDAVSLQQAVLKLRISIALKFSVYTFPNSSNRLQTHPIFNGLVPLHQRMPVLFFLDIKKPPTSHLLKNISLIWTLTFPDPLLPVHASHQLPFAPSDGQMKLLLDIRSFNKCQRRMVWHLSLN